VAKIRNQKEAIIFYPRGGLGNQLFQYGAAYHLSHVLNLPLVADSILLGKSARFNPGLDPRHLELDKFENTLVFAKDNSSLRDTFDTRILTLQRLIGDRFPLLLLKLGIFANEKQDQIEAFKLIKGPIKINSYCSTPEYFSDCQAGLVNQIRKIKNPSNWYLDLIEEILNVNPIAINMRLGDYKNLSHIYGKPDPNYYVKAIKTLSKTFGDRPIWIFSDEPELARELMDSYLTISKIVSHPVNSSPIEYLNALASCRAIVCANSSFSWWAAFISTNLYDKSQIVFPRPMFDSPKIAEPFNWLPSSWITIGRKIN
jgi:hypothetical protein